MCGIIGYKGLRNASDVVINGLKRLEYRGYDSWGMALIGSDMNVVKNVGKIGEVDEINVGEAHIGIGHTRWSTHGKVNKLNAHPHLSCDKKIAIVHNGIIENYQEMRRYLISKDHVFVSDTDSEVIAHLIEEHMKTVDFVEAVRRAVNELKGSYAIVAMHKDMKYLVGAKKDSPLVIGVGENELFFASDVPAFLEYTRDVVFMDDGELAVLNSGVEIFDIETGKKKKKDITHVDWSAEQASKGEFEHFMMKEISEQNRTIKQALSHSRDTIEDIANRINNAFGIFFVACGSSYHAALTASYIFSKIAKKHINVVVASEFPYYKDFLTDRTLMMPISQSGETADVLQAVKTAKEKGTHVVSIVNVVGSSLYRQSDYALTMNAGPEICVLSTKTYTSQLTLLTLLAYACAGKIDEGKLLLERVAKEVEELTSPETRIRLVELASKLKDKKNIFVIGRGVNYPTALEAALKIKEVSYIHAEGFPGGELKHGTIALISEGTPCIVLAPNDETREEIISNAMEIKSRGGYIIGISPENNEVFDFHIKVPDEGIASSILNIIPIQILAYYLAVLRGCDPDKPRNLAKSVTVK
ncbi:MAG: glutamine--fructose-6-phosphate transaminase (isomerizing) [Candidatus Diapherotrites archaeon]|nr:glutamine--fructose-6-phosphate transaminase (isomerizing) [Candidatus Diapherotrites archaeon]